MGDWTAASILTEFLIFFPLFHHFLRSWVLTCWSTCEATHIQSLLYYFVTDCSLMRFRNNNIPNVNDGCFLVGLNPLELFWWFESIFHDDFQISWQIKMKWTLSNTYTWKRVNSNVHNINKTQRHSSYVSLNFMRIYFTREKGNPESFTFQLLMLPYFCILFLNFTVEITWKSWMLETRNFHNWLSINIHEK